MANSNCGWEYVDNGSTVRGGQGGTANTGYSYNVNWCGNRLPCGWCKELGRMCPLSGTTYPTYKTDVTCYKSSETDVTCYETNGTEESKT